MQQVWASTATLKPCGLEGTLFLWAMSGLCPLLVLVVVSEICFIESKVTTGVYQEILDHFMLPPTHKLYVEGALPTPQGPNDYQMIR